MLNIDDLEKRWLRYKLKSYFPHAIVILSIFLITIFIFSSQKSTKQTLIKTKELIKPQDIVVKEANTVIKKVLESTDKIEKKKIILTPSLDFIDNIDIKEQVDIAQKPIITKKVETKIEIIEPQVNLLENTQEHENHIEITRQNTSDDINKVIKRFKTNNNPALSLFVAKKYYEINNYNQAYNYSLITNQLNNNIEDSWIIFAKSLVKLDQKEKSIKILKQYITHSNSNKAKILLDNILSGKFK